VRGNFTESCLLARRRKKTPGMRGGTMEVEGSGRVSHLWFFAIKHGSKVMLGGGFRGRFLELVGKRNWVVARCAW